MKPFPFQFGKIAILSVLTLAVACGGMSSGPAGTAERFIRLVDAGEISDAMGMVSQPMVEMYGDKLRMGLAAQHQEMRANGGISSISITNEIVNGDLATLDVAISYGNGTTEQDQWDLIREGGGWRVTDNK